MTDKEEKLMRDLWDALHEAAYEECRHCQVMVDEYAHENCGITCPYENNRCYVQGWCKILTKVAPLIAKKKKAEE